VTGSINSSFLFYYDSTVRVDVPRALALFPKENPDHRPNASGPKNPRQPLKLEKRGTARRQIVAVADAGAENQDAGRHPAASKPASLGWGACAGFFAGYLLYDMVHFGLHHRRPRSRFGRWLRKLHMRHHFEDDERGFGVSVPWWDVVFGTYSERARGSGSQSVRSAPPSADNRQETDWERCSCGTAADASPLKSVPLKRTG